jgi:hypothetical protein
MSIIIISVIFMLIIIIRSYIHIDNNSVTFRDLVKTSIPAVVGIICLTVRSTYFALPEDAMVSAEYMTYRNILMAVFLAMMGYIVRTGVYSVVFFYGNRN